MQKKVKKAIIAVAGFGTRFLPATKAQPKEMLPIIDKPIIQYIVEEAVKSGIEDIILVTNYNKRSIEDHFGISKELESHLEEQGKIKFLKEIKNIPNLANFIFVRQKSGYGNGSPVLDAKHIIGDEPFAVLWGDDLFLNNKKPHLKQLLEAYYEYNSPIITAMDISEEGTKKYGVIEGEKIKEGIIKVEKLTEKPGPKKTKSRVGSLGGYILTPDIFKVLEKTPLNSKNELCLADSIAIYSQKNDVYAKKIEGEYNDTGNPLSWLKTNVDYALKREDIKEEFKKYLKQKINE
ncbi:UTP--glucose-1-phosphate uridylyltransferase [Patescibacteria group bacterium]|nr:UTP--glucose-1-phosphate uridylyltransferase [Patescibacteria group bacterium]